MRWYVWRAISLGSARAGIRSHAPSADSFFGSIFYPVQEKCEEQVFDLILLDLQMPICTGFEATRMLRDGHGPNKTTPIVALTGVWPDELQHGGEKAR